MSLSHGVNITIEQFEQSEQVNGFFLISLTLQDELLFEEAIGKVFYLNEAPDNELMLFQHAKHNQTHQYQFLTQKPIAKEIFTRPGKLMSSSHSSFINPDPQQPLLILASDLAMANAFAVAKHRSNQKADLKLDASTVVVLESNDAFPFTVKPARYLMPEMPPQAIGACTLLEDWKIQNRLVSSIGLPGCVDGDLSELFAYWVNKMQNQIDNSDEKKWQVLLLTNKITQQKCLQISQDKSWLTVQAFNINC
ncbi:hypothetical protein [Thiomicrorhabdus sp.]|uniref:hypothetical protein n=1 Tax=Thiomicrorhabdus sp. TaxID=2039724 RepID=UPI002AA83699|nr:hypothetical protein [Thiomicrorhabdus sp.]